jgi:hypothetical protein
MEKSKLVELIIDKIHDGLIDGCDIETSIAWLEGWICGICDHELHGYDTSDVIEKALDHLKMYKRLMVIK